MKALLQTADGLKVVICVDAINGYPPAIIKRQLPKSAEETSLEIKTRDYIFVNYTTDNTVIFHNGQRVPYVIPVYKESIA